MGDLDALFHAFYSHFVLRDLLAKITPGAIVLVAISTIFIWQPENVAHYLAGLTFWAWTILLAFSWITGITLQSIGEFFGIRYYPKKNKRYGDFEEEEWHKFYVEFSKRATQDEKREVERLVVIKEACGNGFIALLIVSILLAVKIVFLRFKMFPQLGGCDKLGVSGLVLLIAIIFAYFLCSFHKKHVQRQYNYMLAVIDC